MKYICMYKHIRRAYLRSNRKEGAFEMIKIRAIACNAKLLTMSVPEDHAVRPGLTQYAIHASTSRSPQSSQLRASAIASSHILTFCNKTLNQFLRNKFVDDTTSTTAAI
jgi:hypothetical protein